MSRRGEAADPPADVVLAPLSVEYNYRPPAHEKLEIMTIHVAPEMRERLARFNGNERVSRSLLIREAIHNELVRRGYAQVPRRGHGEPADEDV